MKVETVDNLLTRLYGMKYASCIDLAQSYLQIPLSKECQILVAFSFESQVLKFKRLPFEYWNDSLALMYTVQRILGEELLQRVIVYIDDTLIPGRDMEEHLKLLVEVLEKLSRAGMTVNVSKCKFLILELKFLGFIVTAQGIAKSKVYIETIPKINIPQDIESATFVRII